MNKRRVILFVISTVIFTVLGFNSNVSYALGPIPDCDAATSVCRDIGCYTWDGGSWACRSIKFSEARSLLGNSSVCVPAAASAAQVADCDNPIQGHTCQSLEDGTDGVKTFDSWVPGDKIRIATECATFGCGPGTQCIDFPGTGDGGGSYCARSSNCCVRDASPDGTGVDCKEDPSKTCCNPAATCYSGPADGDKGICAICSSEGGECGVTSTYGGSAICCGDNLVCGEDNVCHTYTPPLECPPGKGFIAVGQVCWEDWMVSEPEAADTCGRCASGLSDWTDATQTAKRCIAQPTGGNEDCSAAGERDDGSSCACNATVKCDPTTNSCTDGVVCKASGEICDVNASAGDDMACCGGFECFDSLDPNPSVGRCDAADCASSSVSCEGPNDCCASSGWTCRDSGSGKVCVKAGDGAPCSGTGCGGGSSSCSPGYKCSGGICIQDEVACPILDPGVISGTGLPGGGYPDELRIKDLSYILGGIAKLLYGIAIGIGLFFIVLSGYKLMTSEGDPRKVQQAQEELTSAVLGIFFVLLSVFLMNIIIVSILGGS